MEQIPTLTAGNLKIGNIAYEGIPGSGKSSQLILAITGSSERPRLNVEHQSPLQLQRK